MGFAAEVDASASTLRVWVADLLVLEANTASKRWHGGRVAGLLALPPNILAETPMPIRVHYARLCPAGAAGAAGALSLLWSSAAGGALTVIPAAAFSPALSGAQEAREAMRRRLYEPAVPWQTYVRSSMGAHTLQPSGLVVRLGLADLAGPPATAVSMDGGGEAAVTVAPELLGAGGHLAACAATSTSFRTTSHVFLSPVLPLLTRREPSSTWCRCVWDADGGLRSDAVARFGSLQGTASSRHTCGPVGTRSTAQTTPRSRCGSCDIISDHI